MYLSKGGGADSDHTWIRPCWGPCLKFEPSICLYMYLHSNGYYCYTISCRTINLLTEWTLVTNGYWFKPWLIHLFQILIFHWLNTLIISISGLYQRKREQKNARATYSNQIWVAPPRARYLLELEVRYNRTFIDGQKWCLEFHLKKKCCPQNGQESTQFIQIGCFLGKIVKLHNNCLKNKRKNDQLIQLLIELEGNTTIFS